MTTEINKHMHEKVGNYLEKIGYDLFQKDIDEIGNGIRKKVSNIFLHLNFQVKYYAFYF